MPGFAPVVTCQQRQQTQGSLILSTLALLFLLLPLTSLVTEGKVTSWDPIASIIQRGT